MADKFTLTLLSFSVLGNAVLGVSALTVRPDAAPTTTQQSKPADVIARASGDCVAAAKAVAGPSLDCQFASVHISKWSPARPEDDDELTPGWSCNGFWMPPQVQDCLNEAAKAEAKPIGAGKP